VTNHDSVRLSVVLMNVVAPYMVTRFPSESKAHHNGTAHF